jgi:hypothetical protein
MPDFHDLAIWIRNQNENQHNLLDSDDRFVVLHSPAFPGLVEDWVKGGESGLDNWTFCELISIARKREFNLLRSHYFDLLTYMQTFIMGRKILFG